jgi:hypothetical protein
VDVCVRRHLRYITRADRSDIMVVYNSPEFQGTRVWLDGVEQDYVEEADNVAGYVIRAIVIDGQIQHDGNHWLHECEFGVVKIELSDIAKLYAY